MSENVITVVELSLDAEGARSRAPELAAWLLSAGVITPNRKRDDLWQPSEFRAGPNVRTATSLWGPDDVDLANNGVDIVVERQLHHPAGNYEPPGCSRCSTLLDEDVHATLGEEWLRGPEPRVTCPACGADALIGDWPGDWTFHVGELAVAFNNWPPLEDEFLERLSELIGARPRLVRAHI